jgi:hypothetical protein
LKIEKKKRNADMVAGRHVTPALSVPTDRPSVRRRLPTEEKKTARFSSLN